MRTFRQASSIQKPGDVRQSFRGCAESQIGTAGLFLRRFVAFRLDTVFLGFLVADIFLAAFRLLARCAGIGCLTTRDLLNPGLSFALYLFFVAID